MATGHSGGSRIARRAVQMTACVLLVLLVMSIGGFVWVKVGPTSAASFTDYVLRPVLGQQAVTALEKFAFNTADTVQQVEYRYVEPTKPTTTSATLPQPKERSMLDLAPIPVLPNFTPLQDEGVWVTQPLDQFPDRQIAAYTFLRPDPERSYAFATVVQLDMRVMQLGLVAGNKQLSDPAKQPGHGTIPKAVIESGNLIAAFNGGFLFQNGGFGMLVGPTTYMPLKKYLGTLVSHTIGSMEIINYTGQQLGSDVLYVRQNCPMLIENGVISSHDTENLLAWGRTKTDDIFTWRSGIGLTKEGNLLYAVGNNLTHLTLAQALKDAGADNAIQLDINPGWVRFNFFAPTGPGEYRSIVPVKKMPDGAKQFLNGSSKDFFYLMKKPG